MLIGLAVVTVCMCNCVSADGLAVQTLALQASGGDGCINLSWLQDSYSTLAGCNLYRSPALTGTYEKINETVLAPETHSFIDTDVEPGAQMFYKFTVVLEDESESPFSNVASAAALDLTPPAITHSPVTSVDELADIPVAAAISDGVGVHSAALHYRATGAGSFTEMAMTNVSGDDWSATIPGAEVLPPALEYYITATDGINTSASGTPSAPHMITVHAGPVVLSVTPAEGPAAGGTTVTITGQRFQAGASVLFGTAPASGVVVVSGTEITCVMPPHLPAQVDVTVTNPDDSAGSLLNAFRFTAAGAVIALPELTGNSGGSVDAAASISAAAGLRSVDLSISYDSGVLTATSVRIGAFTFGWTMSANVTAPGSVVVSMAGSTAVSGSGPLAVVTFDIVAMPPASSSLTVDSASLNDGSIAWTADNGSVTVNPLCTISGRIGYYSGGSAIEGATVALTGGSTASTLTDSSGEFAFPNLAGGNYALTPSKSDDVAEITAYDASLVLQAKAGVIELTADQNIAADVNRNGFVTSMDASYVLEASVGLIEPPFPGAGCVWAFTPAERSYLPLDADQADQIFTAILIGDVSGNWSVPQGDPAPQENSVTLTIPTIRSRTSQTVVVPVQIDKDAAQVLAADLTLAYDPGALSVQNVSAGDAAAGMAFAYNTSQPGLLRAGFAGATPLSQNGTLMEVTCKVVGTLDSPAPVAFQSARVNEGAVPASAKGGSVASVYPGDANLDCRTNVLDLIFIRNRLGQSITSGSNWQADVNQDTKINVLDLIFVRNKLGSSCP